MTSPVKTEPVYLADSAIYGARGAQVLVFYHPNGVSADAFVVCDGFVSMRTGQSADTIEALYAKAATDREFYEAVNSLT